MVELDPDRLKALRHSAGLSRAQLAAEAKVSPRQIARIENAESTTAVRDNTLARLAKGLKIEVGVLSGKEPLPEGFSDSVPAEASIDPSCLRTLRKGRKLSREKLASQSGISARHIARIEGQEEPYNLHPQTLARLARALAVKTAALTGEEPPPPSPQPSGSVRRSIQTGPATRLDYDLVNRRYGVTAQQIIDLAPLLFTMLAEGSLAWRREKLEQMDQALSDLRKLADEHSQLYFTRLQVDIDTGAGIEERSIAQADILGDLARGEDNEYNWLDAVLDVNPFADYMCKLANDIDQPDIIRFKESEAPEDPEDFLPPLVFRHEIYGVKPFRLCPKEMDEITGSSKFAQWALVCGDVRISDIPHELMSEDAKEERVKWLEGRLSSQAREANEKWEKWGAAASDDEL